MVITGHGGKNVGTTFQPDFMNINEFLEGVRKLPEYSKAKIQEEMKKEELEAAIKNLKVKRSPELVGLTAEFYVKVGPVINSELL